MKFLVSLGLLSCMAVLSQSVPHCHLSELWSCAEIAIDWLHSLPKRSIPETEGEVEVMCNELNKAVDCAFGYRDNCSTPLQKELISLVIEGGIALQKDFCTAGSDSRAKYLAHSVCLNKVSRMDEVKEQIEYIMAVFEKAQNVEENQFITFACCGYTKIMNTFIKLGKENCGQEAVDAVEELLGLGIAQLPEIVCGGFNGQEDRCKAILPPDGSKPSDNVKGLAVYKFFSDLLRNWLD